MQSKVFTLKRGGNFPPTLESENTVKPVLKYYSSAIQYKGNFVRCSIAPIDVEISI